MSFDLKTSADCRFCDITSFEDPLVHSKDGTVVPSVGAMVEGWVLVFPTRHVYSLAELEESEWKDFDNLVESARQGVERLYGRAVLFEHGSAGRGRLAACGVDHAHLHIVPIELDLRAAVSKCAHDVGGFEWAPLEGRVQPSEGKDYIYLSDATGDWVTYSDFLPGQVVRRAIARHLGLLNWDWKLDPQTQIVEATRARLLAG